MKRLFFVRNRGRNELSFSQDEQEIQAMNSTFIWSLNWICEMGFEMDSLNDFLKWIFVVI